MKNLLYNVSSGVSEPSSINPDVTLGDLGLDSMMSVEVKQTLERRCGVSMATNDIRQLTITKIAALTSGAGQKPEVKVTDKAAGVKVNIEENELMPSELIVALNHGNPENSHVYIIHPIEGNILIFGSAKMIICDSFFYKQQINYMET